MSIWTLLATFALGGVAGFFVWAIFKTLKRKPPRYLIPATVGVTILAYGIWSDYSWFSRTTAAFPPEVKVVETYTTRVFWQPWTYIVPRIDRFTAVDTLKSRRNKAHPDMVLVEVILVRQYGPAAKAELMIDCAGRRRADVGGGTRLGPDSLPAEAEWVGFETDDPLLRVACSR